MTLVFIKICNLSTPRNIITNIKRKYKYKETPEIKRAITNKKELSSNNLNNKLHFIKNIKEGGALEKIKRDK
jgi:hypothetical protein